MVHFPDGRWKGAEKEGGVRFFRYREGYGCVADVVEINAGYEKRDYFRRCEPEPVQRLPGGAVEVGGEVHEAFGMSAAVFHRLRDLVADPELRPLVSYPVGNILLIPPALPS